MASLAERVLVAPLSRAVVVAALGALGVAAARHYLTQAPAIVGAAGAVAVVAVIVREQGAAVAALGVGAAAAFVSPDGLGPLLVVSGVVVACDVGAADRRLAPWRHVVDAVIVLPAFAGLAGTVAAQPSHRGVALGIASGVVVAGSAWFGRTGRVETQKARERATTSSAVSVGGGLAAFVVTLAPDRLGALGDLPAPTVQAARSVTAGLAVFALVVVIAALRAERGAPPKPPRRATGAAHRRATH